MNTVIQSYTIIRFIININTYTYAMVFKWRTRDLRASQRACVQCDAMKPVNHYDCGGVRRCSVNKTELPHMFIATHIQGIQFMFHEIHISFIQDDSYLTFHAIHIMLSMQYITFSDYYFILVCIVLFLLFPYIRSYLFKSNSPVTCSTYVPV